MTEMSVELLEDKKAYEGTLVDETELETCRRVLPAN